MLPIIPVSDVAIVCVEDCYNYPEVRESPPLRKSCQESNTCYSFLCLAASFRCVFYCLTCCEQSIKSLEACFYYVYRSWRNFYGSFNNNLYKLKEIFCNQLKRLNYC